MAISRTDISALFKFCDLADFFFFRGGGRGRGGEKIWLISAKTNLAAKTNGRVRDPAKRLIGSVYIEWVNLAQF